MMEKMREEFEAAYVAHIQNKLGGPIPKSILNEYLECGSDGEYRSFQAAGAWWGWQKSRESLVVELPRDVDQFADDDPGRRAFSLHTNTAYRECRKAIKAAGLKVKS